VASKTSPVDPEVVRKIAALARLALPDSELSVWTQQLGRIVSYIDQLKELPEANVAVGTAPATTLRADISREGSGRLALQENAPELLHDYVAVPRVVGGHPSEGELERRTPRSSSNARSEQSEPADRDAG
jgi:aspartyl-tRNA(Asn)/glutamyl-tRNA(Gln) amidotransferase subunit C